MGLLWSVVTWVFALIMRRPARAALLCALLAVGKPGWADPPVASPAPCAAKGAPPVLAAPTPAPPPDSYRRVYWTNAKELQLFERNRAVGNAWQGPVLFLHGEEGGYGVVNDKNNEFSTVKKSRLEATLAKLAEGTPQPAAPVLPALRSLDDVQTRDWYHARLEEIDGKVAQMRAAGAKPEDIAKEAHGLRNEAKMQARELMSNREGAAKLPPPLTWEEALKKYGGDYEKIIGKSQTSNGAVDRAIELRRVEGKQGKGIFVGACYGGDDVGSSTFVERYGSKLPTGTKLYAATGKTHPLPDGTFMIGQDPQGKPGQMVLFEKIDGGFKKTPLTATEFNAAAGKAMQVPFDPNHPLIKTAPASNGSNGGKPKPLAVVDTPASARPQTRGIMRTPGSQGDRSGWIQSKAGGVMMQGNVTVVWAEAVMTIDRMIKQYDKEHATEIAELNDKAFRTELEAWMRTPASELRSEPGERDNELLELGKTILPYFVDPVQIAALMKKGDHDELNRLARQAAHRYLEMRFLEETGWKPRWTTYQRYSEPRWYKMPLEQALAFDDPVYTAPDGTQTVTVRKGGNLARLERSTEYMSMGDYVAMAKGRDFGVKVNPQYDTPAPKVPSLVGRVRDLPKVRMPYTADGVDEWNDELEWRATPGGRVDSIYRELVGRPPALAEAKAALEGLENKPVVGPLPSVRRAAVDSKEGRERMAEIYRRHLGRDPRPGELDGWANAIAAGMSFPEYELAVERSPEAKKVDVFRGLFDRDPGAGEMDRLAQDKNGDAFREALARSPDFRNKLAARMKDNSGVEPAKDILDRWVELFAKKPLRLWDLDLATNESSSLYDSLLGRAAKPTDAPFINERAVRIAERKLANYTRPDLPVRAEMIRSPEGRAAIERVMASLGLTIRAGADGDKTRANIDKYLESGKTLGDLRRDFAGNKTVRDSLDRVFVKTFGRDPTPQERDAALDAVRDGEKTPQSVATEWARLKKSGGSPAALFP